MADDVVFHERQQFRQRWLWVLLCLTAVPALIAVSVAAWQEFQRGSMVHGTISVLLALIGCAAPLALMLFARLDVAVTSRELVFRFVPFHRKPRRIPLAGIAEARQRRYDPLGEYGGWGIRGGMGANDVAYNVSGDDGVQLVLDDGRRILIGSQKAMELEAAIASGRDMLSS